MGIKSDGENDRRTNFNANVKADHCIAILCGSQICYCCVNSWRYAKHCYFEESKCSRLWKIILYLLLQQFYENLREKNNSVIVWCWCKYAEYLQCFYFFDKVCSSSVLERKVSDIYGNKNVCTWREEWLIVIIYVYDDLSSI